MVIDGSEPPRKIILRLTEWLESNPLIMRESVLPILCTDEMADLLGLPDGTPVFYHTVALVDIPQESKVCWDMISTANIFFREMKLE